jgi:hypothetical protein
MLRKTIRRSVFRVLGYVPRDASINDVQGVLRWERIFGDHGLLLYFADIITTRELVNRLEIIPRLMILSITDLSGSTSTKLSQDGFVANLANEPAE